MKSRSEIPSRDCWNIALMYKTNTDWEKDFTDLKNDMGQIEQFRGRLSEDASCVRKLLDTARGLERRLDKVYVYAHLRHDEDTANVSHKAMYDRSLMLFQDYSQKASYIYPELKSLEGQKLEGYLNHKDLKEYRFVLEKFLREKQHVLTHSEENIMALFSTVMRTAMSTFDALHDGDMKFPDVVLSDGSTRPLSHGQYHHRLISTRREEREKSFRLYYAEFAKLGLTYTSLLQGCVHSHWSRARARKFNSCLEAALFADHFDASVYTNLIDTVRAHLSTHHRYFQVKKTFLELPELHLFDTHVSLAGDMQPKYSFEDAVKMILSGLAALGGEYLNVLEDGIKKGWVDKYENQNKRSGAYSSGCYDSEPYILMNFDGTLRAVFTLAHELGHSMHKYFSGKTQPPQYAEYSIFIAEIASTVNEQLLARWMLEHTDDSKEKIYLLSQQLDDLRATLVRQTMFAEFEWKIHQAIEQDTPLTLPFLNSNYRQLNEAYYGPNVVIDSEIAIEWARIPHFYYNFYVYKYATGISAAIHIAKKLNHNDSPMHGDYLRLLKAGGSQYPGDILGMVGIDLAAPDFIVSACQYYDYLVSELAKLSP